MCSAQRSELAHWWTYLSDLAWFGCPAAWNSRCQADLKTFHNATYASPKCRRQIEKSLFAQIEMSLSTASVGEYWADDGDYDEPDGDRPDGRIARSGRWQDQDRRGVDVDGAWSASGVPAGEGLRQAWS